MTVKLSDMDVSGSSNDTANNSGASESGSDDEHAEFEAAVEGVGGNVEHARAYVDANGAKEKFMDFIASLDEDMMEQAEEYRLWNDQHRIRQRFLHNVDGDFSTWSSQFYGNSDDPDPETYNGVQQASRDAGVNLAFYKALFPEPQEEYWPAEPVLYEEVDRGYGEGQQDSHIYVSQEFVNEYSDFTMDVNGEAKPRPPTDDELQAMSNGGASASSTPSESDKYRDMDHDELKEEARDRGIADDVDLRSKSNIREALLEHDDAAETEQAELSDAGSSEQMTVTINGNEVTGDKDFIKSLLDN